MTKAHALAMAVVFAIGACGKDEDKKEDASCKPEDATACKDGLVCEQLGATRFECLAPVLVTGRVFNALDDTGIAGATIVGVDVNGAARTRVAESGPDGRYELPVSVKRNEDGVPLEDAITLRVAGKDHQPFPSAPRTALPIELKSAVTSSAADAGADDAAPDSYRLQNAATDVALIPLPADRRGGVSVRGKIAAAPVTEDETQASTGGVLVLAGSGATVASSAISDLDGAFVLFNVPVGSTGLEGYRAGVAIEPKSVDVPAAGLSDVTLELSDAKLSEVKGSISVVNAEGGLTTSVILVVASTFDPNAARGEAPAGLRAGAVSGAFVIEDVPPGRYAVLAAFENDLLVRDPDEGIGGTDIVFVDVGTSGGVVDLDQGFKVTGALEVVSPGAQGIESVSAGPLTLEWNDDSSEDGYELRVYDALGNLAHEDTEVPRVTGSANVTYALDAADYQPGMLYQFRVWSWRERQGGRTYISASEDLKGVFEIAR